MGLVGMLTIIGHFRFTSVVIALVTHVLGVLLLVSMRTVEDTSWFSLGYLKLLRTHLLLSLTESVSHLLLQLFLHLHHFHDTEELLLQLGVDCWLRKFLLWNITHAHD